MLHENIPEDVNNCISNIKPYFAKLWMEFLASLLN